MGRHGPSEPLVPAICRHLPWLDVLRGIAIIMVVGLHFLGETYHAYELPWAGLWRDPAAAPGRSYFLWYPLVYGGAGVTLFFVLSGYVIHRSRLVDPAFTWRKYTIRRFFRIYPAYLVALVGFALWLGVHLGSWQFLSHVLLVHDLFTDTDIFFGINGSFWSLATEAQLYLLYPVALLARRRYGPGGMLLCGCIVSVAWRACAFATTNWPGSIPGAIWYAPLALWPDWLIGAYLADRHFTGGPVFRRPRFVAALSIVAWLVSDVCFPTALIGRSLAAPAFAVFLEWGLKRPDRLGPVSRRLAALGFVSYSVYLLHQPLIAPFLHNLAFLRIPGLWRPALQMAIGLPLFLLLIALAGTLLYRLVERPGIALGQCVEKATRRPDAGDV